MSKRYHLPATMTSSTLRNCASCGETRKLRYPCWDNNVIPRTWLPVSFPVSPWDQNEPALNNRISAKYLKVLLYGFSAKSWA